MSQQQALIVDDEILSAEIMAALLGEEGISPTTVIDPTQAIETFQAMPRVDIIFCDLEMPQLNGYELLKLFRAQVGANIPIVAYTIHLSQIEMARRLGFNSFLGKPLDPDYFPNQIRRILNGESIWVLP